ncbi:MAG: hypothetical protein A2741_01555 [Candidatus Zambryskibacteria bacterium RIFCSPHIGHO2_01_FULL_43_27]|uniref:Uncharacterized protein n=1 Tax=Candidatus Zambryskibacteria bacterium RIFCSPLOWO2_01_FULL_43_17 TaxID=1802760 RepID=A0A1G2U478_9BACT|nr:MAG: hypothetical protein A2741_01555 [Candidatus Zambryskibacteria bacterium RIFCSPHIGHO2_01_FULL_43_27]OHA99476.1 MAG: hypothetical protein A3E93_02760 [Candidatus Zambryskibacteria bacterium RIFCSPHIGHO2_12_FULL_43_12b]OHB04317.1 MAG: hypothetical protein A2920_03350 [Candidatus Zambryskibacteria bacterium RIFCSPLOWO2_01_FULL_43_17]
MTSTTVAVFPTETGYAPPRLIRFGDFRELVRTAGGGDDQGDHTADDELFGGMDGMEQYERPFERS